MKVLDIIVKVIQFAIKYSSTILSLYKKFTNKKQPSNQLPKHTDVVDIDIPIHFDEPEANNLYLLECPNKPENCITGSSFAQQNMNLSGDIREQNTYFQFEIGNLPDFLRQLEEITVSDGYNTLKYYCTKDVISIGNNEDYFRMPMKPGTAQKIANLYNCTLPTTKMSRDIAKAAKVKLQPIPLGPPYDNSMQTTKRIMEHENKVNIQLADYNYDTLTTGQKKDIVITNKLYPDNNIKKVAIFGWFYPNGNFIQPLNASSHDNNYLDYSHGVRLISNRVMLNDKETTISEIFKDVTLCKLVSEEGVVKFTKY